MDSPEFSLQIINKTFWWTQREITWAPLKYLQFSTLTKQSKKPFSHAHFIFSFIFTSTKQTIEKKKKSTPMKLRDLA